MGSVKIRAQLQFHDAADYYERKKVFSEKSMELQGGNGKKLQKSALKIGKNE